MCYRKETIALNSKTMCIILKSCAILQTEIRFESLKYLNDYKLSIIFTYNETIDSLTIKRHLVMIYFSLRHVFQNILKNSDSIYYRASNTLPFQTSAWLKRYFPKWSSSSQISAN